METNTQEEIKMELTKHYVSELCVGDVVRFWKTEHYELSNRFMEHSIEQDITVIDIKIEDEYNGKTFKYLLENASGERGWVTELRYWIDYSIISKSINPPLTFDTQRTFYPEYNIGHRFMNAYSRTKRFQKSLYNATVIKINTEIKPGNAEGRFKYLVDFEDGEREYIFGDWKKANSKE